MKTFSYVSAVVLAAAISTTATAETRVTYKSAKTTSSYYQMAVQIAEAMKKGSKGDIIVTVGTPLDSMVFLGIIDHLSAIGVIAMTASKMMGALIVWWLIRRREVEAV